MKKLFTLLFSIVLIHFAQAQTVKALWSSCGGDINPTPTDMAVDSRGNSYVTGYIGDTAIDNYLLHHFFLQKTDARGNVEWIRYYPVSDSFDAGRAVATDRQGNVYVTGDRYDTSCNICTIQTPHSYLFTIKYDGSGNVIWVNSYDGPEETNQQPAELSISPDGIAYVIANEKKYDPAQGRYFTKMVAQKIFRNGSTAWIRKTADATGNGISYDKDDNVLVAASYSPSGIYQLNKFYVVKYNHAGATLWSRTVDEYQKNGNAYFIAADTAGNVFVNGQTDTIAFYNNPRILTAKYSATGNLIWAKKEADATQTLPHFYGSYTIDSKGNSYIVGYKKLSSIDRDYLTTKRDVGGNLIWSNQYSDIYHGESVPLSIAVYQDSAVYVTGYSYSRNSTYVFTTIHYDSNGGQQWLKTYSRTRQSNNFPIGLGLDAKGNVYVAGGAGGGVCTIKYGEKAPPIPMAKAIAVPETTGQLMIFPNPCGDVLHVNAGFLKQAKYNYTIFDRSERMVLNASLEKQQVAGNLSISVKDLPGGFYILQLTDGKGKYIQKFIKL